MTLTGATGERQHVGLTVRDVPVFVRRSERFDHSERSERPERFSGPYQLIE